MLKISHRLVSYYDIFIITASQFSCGEGKKLVGRQRSPDPVIEHGFFVYENLEGAKTGLNLRDVLQFSIEPHYSEEM